jgi:hypothetical protein
MAKRDLTVVFVHGWSVTNTATYGGLPARLRAESARRGLDIDLRHLFLGRYISFHDEVRLPDVSRAFRTAVEEELASLLADDRRFACITHSTGGPVIRDWWRRYYVDGDGGRCPMSHLVMLAPANFGSALAQLGKSRVGRLKAWMGGVEPGQGILDWLELGSDEARALNTGWIHTDDRRIAADGLFPFVLTGQTIDRAFYDHLNAYTGEPGSDGVVRVAAANLNARHVLLSQSAPEVHPTRRPRVRAPALELESLVRAPETALRIVRGAAHSGASRGIMRGVHKAAGHRKGRDAVAAILECLSVTTKADYRRVMQTFEAETAIVRNEERVETVERLLGRESHFVHDRHAMIVFRVIDDEGRPVDDFDLLLTAGPDSDPDALPRGFFQDRQRNSRARNTITYYLNYDLMLGSDEIRDGDLVVRPRRPGIDRLGLELRPRPDRGFAHYLDCRITASRELLGALLQPDGTTLVDIRLTRVVRKNVFRLQAMKGDSTGRKFSDTPPGPGIAR